MKALFLVFVASALLVLGVRELASAEVGSNPRDFVREIEKLGGTVSLRQEGDGGVSATVTLRGSKVTVEALASVARFGSVGELRLENARVTDSELRKIGALRRLRSLDLCTPIDERGLPHLKPLSDLEFLRLCASKVDSDSAALIAGFRNLNMLYLEGCRISDEALRKIATLKKLRTLSLAQCTGLSEHALREIGTIENLESIDLSEVKDAGKNVGYLRELRLLRTVNLSVIATDSTLKQLEGLDSLREITLASGEVSDAGFKHLAKLRNLENIVARSTRISDIGLGYVKSLSHLRELWLDDTSVTDAGLVNFYGLKELRVLTLPEKTVTEGAVDKLRKALPKCYISRNIWFSGGGLASPESKRD